MSTASTFIRGSCRIPAAIRWGYPHLQDAGYPGRG
jgi:hypothetical protein